MRIFPNLLHGILRSLDDAYSNSFQNERAEDVWTLSWTKRLSPSGTASKGMG